MKMDGEQKKRVMQVLHVAESRGEYCTPLLMGSSRLSSARLADPRYGQLVSLESVACPLLRSVSASLQCPPGRQGGDFMHSLRKHA